MYQISIALNGKFLFRTDWMDNSINATMALEAIKAKFHEDKYSITLNAKSPMSLGIKVKNVQDAIYSAVKYIYPNS